MERLLVRVVIVVLAFGLQGCEAEAGEPDEEDEVPEETIEKESAAKDDPEPSDDRPAAPTLKLKHTGDDSGGSSNPLLGIARRGSPFAGEYDLRGFARRLQGIWVAHHDSEYAMHRKVWRFDEDEIDLWEQGNHLQMRYEVVSPCEVEFIFEDDVRTQRMSRRIALGEEKNYAETMLGVETDRGAVVCADKTYELTESGCTAYSYSIHDEEYKSEEADCRMEEDAVVVEGTKLKRVGEIFVENDTSPGGLVHNELVRFESLEEAKKLIEE